MALSPWTRKRASMSVFDVVDQRRRRVPLHAVAMAQQEDADGQADEAG
jgi:hypothetical protein